MLKDSNYFLSGFHRDKEYETGNSPLSLHMRIFLNYFIFPWWIAYLQKRAATKDVLQVTGCSYSSSIHIFLERLQTKNAAYVPQSKHFWNFFLENINSHSASQYKH